MAQVSSGFGTYQPGRTRRRKKHKAQGALKPIGQKPGGKFGRPNGQVLSPTPIGGGPSGGFGPSAGAPGATATSKPAGAPVQPLDPAVEQEKIVGQRNVALGDAYSTWQQANLDSQYGFGAGGAANPYSDAAKLQRNYKNDVLGTTSGLASQGQYNSGAYGSAQNENARNFDMGYDALRRGYDQASGNLQFNRLQTYANAGTGTDAAKFDALLNAIKGL